MRFQKAPRTRQGPEIRLRWKWWEIRQQAVFSLQTTSALVSIGAPSFELVNQCFQTWKGGCFEFEKINNEMRTPSVNVFLFLFFFKFKTSTVLYVGMLSKNTKNQSVPIEIKVDVVVKMWFGEKKVAC